jgi:hypothetical protein
MEKKIKEGWTYLFNSRKWHYFTSKDNKSICGKFLLLALPELEQGNDNSPDNCKACQKSLKKRTPKGGDTSN